uniref:Diphthine synthase n=1 Tax=Lactuca sativa TaxID=4236 RepID=A0A9R1XR44_LACSA|nr:hypothetical protein LSAT_V11C200054280 [Lactuca sativa]
MPQGQNRSKVNEKSTVNKKSTQLSTPNILSSYASGTNNLIGIAYIRVKEPSLESLCIGKKQYRPPSFMPIGVAIDKLLEVEQLPGESEKMSFFLFIFYFLIWATYNEETLCVGFSRLGSEKQKVVAGSMKQLREVDFGQPLHCLTIVGKTHLVEEEMLDFYRI